MFKRLAIVFALLLVNSTQAHFYEPATEPRDIHNTEDEWLPHIEILGFSDLDIVDFLTGAAERFFDRDVRKNWHHCWKTLNWQWLWTHIMQLGFYKVLAGEFYMALLNDKRGKNILENYLPQTCHTMADEVAEFELWVRNEFINPLHFAAVIGYTFKNLGEDLNDVFDIWRRFLKHDFYEMVRDYADMFVVTYAGQKEKEMSEAEYEELDIDDF